MQVPNINPALKWEIATIIIVLLAIYIAMSRR